MQIDDHIAEQIADKTARVDRLRAVGIEIDESAYAQGHVLILILRYAVLAVEVEICEFFVFVCFNACNDFLDGALFPSIIGRARARVRVFAHVHVLGFVKHVVACRIFDVGQRIADSARHGCVRAGVERCAFRALAVVELAEHARLHNVFACRILRKGVVHRAVDKRRFFLITVFVETVDKRENVAEIVVERYEIESIVYVEQGFVGVNGFEVDFCVQSQIERPGVLFLVSALVFERVFLVCKSNRKTQSEHLIVAVLGKRIG